MAVELAIWKLGENPTRVQVEGMPFEAELQSLLVNDIGIANPNWLVIGREVPTKHGGKIDILAIDFSGSIVVIELKRDQTDREIIGQILDYASWVASLQAEDISKIYTENRHKIGQQYESLDEAFFSKFMRELDPEDVNKNHDLVIVGRALDVATQRIAEYLASRQVRVTALLFNTFKETDGPRYLVRAWLADPDEVVNQPMGSAEAREWNGEFYACYGDAESRSWEDGRQFGFICGGGGPWYSNSLKLLDIGDRVWVNVPGKGYVGVGRVKEKCVPLCDFYVHDESGARRRFIEVADPTRTYHRDATDPAYAEYFVSMDWIHSVPLSEAVREIGFFGNQNTVCRPKNQKWIDTVDKLRNRWNVTD